MPALCNFQLLLLHCLSRIILYAGQKLHDALLPGLIKQLNEVDRFVEGRFCEFSHVFDVAVLRYIVDYLFHEDDLLLVQGLVVDEL